MALIADLFLIAAAMGAAFYCFVLSRRLSALNSAEGGIGKAIGTLSEQVTRLEQALDQSRERAEEAERELSAAIKHAENLQTELSQSFQPGSAIVPRPTPTVPDPRAEAQPASFRRRLFSETSVEGRT